MAEDDIALLRTAGILFVVLAATVFVYFRIVIAKPGRDWKSELASTKASATTNDPQVDPKDVWEERRKRGVTASSSAGKTSAADKPFGSSYYYAHNNPNATGGYKDGLRMEDYTMNQPRLLSKGGVPAEPSETTTVESSTASEPTTTMPTASKKKVDAPVVKRISKFLWDDPGDANGVATIRIDALPGSTLTETISWREANINDISTTLVNDKKGLLIELTSADGTIYRLQIPKLYGEVDEVRKVAKPNRLLVRLYKKKNWLNPFDKTNLQSWPRPGQGSVLT
jgi:hypothetical protein